MNTNNNLRIKVVKHTEKWSHQKATKEMYIVWVKMGNKELSRKEAIKQCAKIRQIFFDQYNPLSNKNK